MGYRDGDGSGALIQRAIFHWLSGCLLQTSKPRTMLTVESPGPGEVVKRQISRTTAIDPDTITSTTFTA